MADEGDRVVEHDEAGERFVLRVDGEEAGELRYRVDGDRLVLEHTVVDPDRRERGLGTTLVRGALEEVRRRGRRAVPQCPFVRTFVEREPGYDDVVDGGSSPAGR